MFLKDKKNEFAFSIISCVLYQDGIVYPATNLSILITANMEFSQKELMKRKIELTHYLRIGLPLKDTAIKTGLTKRY